MMEKLLKYFRRLAVVYDSKTFLWSLLGLGVVLRVAQYAFNRALWLDEAYLALSLINTPFSGLLRPLDCDQATPVGFLYVEKILVRIFGDSEYILRLIPLLCGILALFLFYRLAQRFLASRTIPLALGIFAVCGPLIYYSSEVKPYSSDVAAALLLVCLLPGTKPREWSTPSVLRWGLAGAVAVWFSHPSIFILAGMALIEMALCIQEKEWAALAGMVAACSLWALSFAVNYFMSLRGLSNNPLQGKYWAFSFMPFPPFSLAAARWLAANFRMFFINPLGFSWPWPAAFAFLAGFVAVIFKKRKIFFASIASALLTLAASASHKYPFSGRLLIFLAPWAILFIAEGAERTRALADKVFPLLGSAFIGILIVPPVMTAGIHLLRPHEHEEIRPVLSYLKEHRRDSDLVYLYYNSRAAFQYYAKRYGFAESEAIIGFPYHYNREDGVENMDKFRGRARVWVLIAHVIKTNGVDDDKIILDSLEAMGTRLDSFRAFGAAVYLYDLRRLWARPDGRGFLGERPN